MHKLQAVHGKHEQSTRIDSDCTSWRWCETLSGGCVMGDYMAWIRYADGTEQQWTGLRKTQAQWRYHWIRRNWWNSFRDAKGWGWRLEP